MTTSPRRRRTVAATSGLALASSLLLLAPFSGALTSSANASPSCQGWVGKVHQREVLSAPAGQRPTARHPEGATVIPNGRFLTPAGRSVTTAPHPYGLVLSPDGHTAVTANSGTAPFSLSVVSNVDTDHPTVRQIPPGTDNAPDVLGAVFMGLVIGPDNRTLYASGGNDGIIAVFDLVTGQRTRTFDLNVPFGGRPWRDSYLGDLALSPDLSTLWVVDQANFRLVAVDRASGNVVKVAQTGRYPFGVALTPDGRDAFVANVGAFQYSYVDGWTPSDPTGTGLSFPASAYQTEAAHKGTVVQGKHVPGLGSPNDPASFSLWRIDTATGSATARLKTGPLVGDVVGDGVKAVGGSSPNSVVTDGRNAYVSNNNSDSVAVVDVPTSRVVAQIPLGPTATLGRLKGALPFGLALSRDSRYLYVAESGINAVAVVDTTTRTVLGHVPVGWYPAKVQVSPDGGQLYVTNAKGLGSGPNGGQGYTPGPEGTYIGRIQKGTVSAVPLPDLRTAAGTRQLAVWTSQVLANNGFEPRPGTDPLSIDEPAPPACPIKHVIFVTKENRTFDEVYGDLGKVGGTPVNGDPTLARFGAHATVTSSDGSRTVRDVNVMPNHRALAQRFALGDNFYVDSDVSADGHRWLVGVAPNEFVETSWSASYGGKRGFDYTSTSNTPFSAPGRRGFTEANASLAPEDYPEAGSIWENFARNGVGFRNYGEGFELAGIYENAGYEPTGARLPTNVPMPNPLLSRTDTLFPTFNTSITDQYRMDEFQRDFTTRYVRGSQSLPQFTNVYLPQDHGSGEAPERGYPYYASYMADNDLALGRLVDLVSHSKYWGSTAIVVTEDDSQDGVDHVDAHRSLALVISPWVKPGTLIQAHTSIASVIKTVDLLTGAPFLNQYDAAATSLLGAFTDTPDLRPYTYRAADPRIFDPAAARLATEVGTGSAQLDDPQQLQRSHDQQLQGAARPTG